MGIWSALTGGNAASSPVVVRAQKTSSKRAAGAARRGGSAIVAVTHNARPQRVANVRSGGRGVQYPNR